MTKTYREIAKVTRATITQGKDIDCFVDPATIGVTLSLVDADVHNGLAANQFLTENKGYFPSESNWSAIKSYLRTNGVRIFSPLTLRAAYLKLDGCRL